MTKAVNQRQYEPGVLLGRGGMGEVRRVVDVRVGREVALKVMRGGARAGAGARRRFLLEARVLGRLEHPNIVPIHDLGVDQDGRLYYTMKLVRGRTLGQVLAALGAGSRRRCGSIRWGGCWWCSRKCATHWRMRTRRG